MSLRKDWKFEYSAVDLADAASTKKEHHKSRLEWWDSKQKEIIEQVKANGLEVSESLSMEYGKDLSLFAGSTNAVRGAQLVVKNDYQTKLNECHMKIRDHGSKVKEYDGWLQMLEANIKQNVSLDIDDYLFFFGK